MKFYGVGALRYPGTNRVIHDFEDGPFSTVNPEIIRHALAMGFSTVAPAAPLPSPVLIAKEDKIEVGPDAPIVSKPKTRGRPRKEAM